MGNNTTGNNWVECYTNWLHDNYQVKKFKNGDELTTPFTNSIGDNIRIYVVQKQNGEIQLTDDGATLNGLDMMGIDLNTDTRTALIQSILKQYKIKRDHQDTLYINGKLKEFPLIEQQLLQAIIHLDDLFYTRKAVSTNIFREEVLNFFIENSFGGLPKYDVDGSSGIPYKIDYAMGRTQNQPWRFFQIVNRPTFETIAYQSLVSDDVKNNDSFKSSALKYVLVVNTQNTKLNTKSRTIASRYGVDLVPWKNKSELLTMR